MSLANNGALTDVWYRVKQDVRLTVSANPAEMPPLREDLSKMWNEPSLRRRRCSSVLQVDPSLAQQHNEEPRRPCSFSAHQQFTIRAATTTNSVLSKREDASVHQLIDSRLSQLQLFKNRLIWDLDERRDKGWWTYWIDMSCCTGSWHQSIYRIPLLFIKWSKSWLNLLRQMMWHCATTHFNHGRQQSATFSRGSPLQPTRRSGPAARQSTSCWTARVNGLRFAAALRERMQT